MIRSQRSDLLIGQHCSAGIDQYNQDSYTVVSFEPVEPRIGLTTLAVIADGRGQLIRYEENISSQLVVGTIVEQFQESSAADIMTRLKRGFQTAHNRLNEHKDPAWIECTAVVVADCKLYWASVGQCRSFIFHTEGIAQITRHTFVERIVELGQLTVEEALSPHFDDSFPEVLGGGNDNIEPVYGADIPLKAGNQILIVSTGVLPRNIFPSLYGQYRFDLLQPDRDSQISIDKFIEQRRDDDIRRDMTAILLRIPDEDMNAKDTDSNNQSGQDR